MVTKKSANIKNWASILDENTRLQAEMLSRSEVVWGHVALMPDAHLGKGATVGSVIATKGAVIPAAVGVDIGCGMCAVQTDLLKGDLPADLQPLHGQISRSVRAGWGERGQWKEPRDAGLAWLAAHPPSHGVVAAHLERQVAQQFGTLGSGNHFIEVCIGAQDVVWVVLHSGSRGVGNRLAIQHIKAAVQQCQDNGVVLEDPDLAFLTEGSEEFGAYIDDMNWCQQYALGNREAMIDAVLNQLYRFVGHGSERLRINCHHNFTQKETHFGEAIWLTRKGAIFADKGVRGVVPGSMATATFITEGLGNPDSYLSSAHGGGRQMSRGQAKRELPMDGVGGLHTLMEGIAWNVDDAKQLLDEHPLAYKDIYQVMADQKDLCRPVDQLRQVLNFKGP